MYNYTPPTPLMVDLANEYGYKLREKAAEYVKGTLAGGKEAGSPVEQSYGALAEIVIRDQLELPDIDEGEEKDTGYDIELSTGVKVDVKCRGGTLDFQEEYPGTYGINRETKHNFFARQVYDDKLKTDIYLMTQLTVPFKKADLLAGSVGAKWRLYVCGWVSKKRVQKEGIYLPRGSLTEQGRTWFTYRAEQIEFYHKNLNGLSKLDDLLNIGKDDVGADGEKQLGLHLTYVDACRIASDLATLDIIPKEVIRKLKERFQIEGRIPRILHPNQYRHLLEWLMEEEIIPKDNETFEKLSEHVTTEEYKR